MHRTRMNAKRPVDASGAEPPLRLNFPLPNVGHMDITTLPALRTRAATLAAAVALAVGACSKSGTEAPPIAEAPVEADAEARLPHLMRPVIVEAPEDELADGGIGSSAAPPERAADREARAATERYIAGRDAVVAAPPAAAPAVQGPGATAATPAPARPRDAVPAPRAVEARAPSRTARVAPTVEVEPPVAGVARDPDQARSLNQRAIAQINAGRPEEAIPALERAVAMQPRDAEMLGNLGYAYMLAGEHDRARTQFMRALDLAPTRSATWLNLGQTYAELGQRDVAVDAVLKGYRYSTRKPSVRSALQRAAEGGRHSTAWREAAGLALERIADGRA